MMLALFDPATDKSLTDISLIIGGLMAAVYYGKEIFFPRDKTPQPFKVQASEKYVLAEHCALAHGEIVRQLGKHEIEITALREMIRIELPAMERRITKENDNHSILIHNRINEILEAVSELRGEVKAQ